MFLKFLALAQNAFVETIRQPIYGVILIAMALLLMLNVSLAGFTFGQDQQLLLELSLSTLLLSGLFLSAFSAAGVLGREIDNMTVLTVISKPVGRPMFVLGKFTGLAGALVIALYLGTLVLVLCVRHGVLENTSDPWDAPVLAFGFGSVGLAFLVAAFCNYLYGMHFATTTIWILTPLLTIAVLAVGKFDEHFEVIAFGSNYVGGQVIIAAFLVLLAVLFAAAVAVAASTRLGQLMTLIVCVVVLGLGVVADYAFGRHAETSFLASVAYTFVPNIGPFWVVDGLVAGTAQTMVTGWYLVLVTGYASLLISAALAVAIAAFQKREVG